MSINKGEYLDAEEKIHSINKAIFVEKDETDVTRVSVGDTAPTNSHMGWIKPNANSGQSAGLNYGQLDAYFLRRNSTEYFVGDIVLSTSIDHGLGLECITAGTTAATEPPLSNLSKGDTVQDGEVVWSVQPIFGGDLSVIKLTQDQYDLLPADAKNDPKKLYVVLDADATIQYVPYIFNKIVKFTNPTGSDINIVPSVTQTAYTIPYTGWYKFTVIGGGGAGIGGKVQDSSNLYQAGAGGGEGGKIEAYLYLLKNTSCTILVGFGARGTAKQFNSIGLATTSNGFKSQVVINDVTIQANGGASGSLVNNFSMGGAGGTASLTGNNDISYKVTNGANGGNGNLYSAVAASTQYPGGLGAGKDYGSGGAGGAVGETDALTTDGQSGSNGVVYIEYFDPDLTMTI